MSSNYEKDPHWMAPELTKPGQDTEVDEYANIQQDVDTLIAQMETELAAAGEKREMFAIQFKNPKHFTWFLVTFASMGGLLSGLDQSLISGANLYLPVDLGLNAHQASLINSGMPLGAVIGSLLISPCNEYLGRRWAIVIACVLYTVGAALCAGSINFPMLLVARLILGSGVGLEGGTVPVYVAETVERRLRGNLVSLYQLMIALGEVLGYAVGAIFLSLPGNWRYILGSSVVFSTIMLIGTLFIPESPRWLMHKGDYLGAYSVWKRIRGAESRESCVEFYEMKSSLELELLEIQQGHTKRFPWMDLFTNKRARRALVYANIMIFLGQFTGINAVMYYMSILMSKVGFDDKQSNYMALVGGGSLLLGTIPAIFYMELCGRRFWALATLPGFFIGLILVGVSYQLPIEGNLATVQGLYLTGLILYEGFFGCYSTLTWVIPAEVYPTYLRSYGMTISSAWVFLASFIVTYNFTAMDAAMTGIGLTLGFYGGIAICGWFYQLLFMPETKNKTLEEIDLIFEKPTALIVRDNLANSRRTCEDLLRGRFRKVATEVQPVR
ncbi:MAG: hypothetical protein M1818_000396 [Claussenomyces sp. TS43310]|nr:MAG: hypothetical protein M1818_000396 [Claussenomyces sp. TS43310]